MKRILVLFLFSFVIVVFGRSPALASCDFFQDTAPTCDATTVGLMWCDIGTPGSATNPILKACDDVTGTWNQVQLTTRNLNTTFNSNITISGTRTLDAGSNKWTMVADPTAAQDAATKAYVDSLGKWGTATDGDVTISADTTLTMDMYYNMLTINSGITLTTDGFLVFVKDTLAWNGTIGAGTGAAGNNANGVDGTNGGQPKATTLGGIAGGWGGAKSNSNAPGLNANTVDTGVNGSNGGTSNFTRLAAGIGLKHGVIRDYNSALALVRAGIYAAGGSGAGAPGTLELAVVEGVQLLPLQLLQRTFRLV